jgi:hypothetical protein
VALAGRQARLLGIGLLIKDNIAVEEEVLEQTYEGKPYEYPLVRVFEIAMTGRSGGCACIWTG